MPVTELVIHRVILKIKSRLEELKEVIIYCIFVRCLYNVHNRALV